MEVMLVGRLLKWSALTGCEACWSAASRRHYGLPSDHNVEASGHNKFASLPLSIISNLHLKHFHDETLLLNWILGIPFLSQWGLLRLKIRTLLKSGRFSNREAAVIYYKYYWRRNAIEESGFLAMLKSMSARKHAIITTKTSNGKCTPC